MKTRQMTELRAFEGLTRVREGGHNWLWRGLLVGCLALGVGCQSKPKAGAPEASNAAEKTEEKVAKKELKEGAQAELPEGMIVKTGPVEVTLKDFEYALHLKRLVASMDALEPPAEYLSSRTAQMQVLEDLIMDGVIAHELSQRNLTLSDAEKAAALRTEPGLARYAPILESAATSGAESGEAPLAELEARGLTREDLEYAGEVIAGELKLRDAFLEEMSEEAVWEYFARKNDRAEVLAFSMTNAPTMGELMSLVESEPERIEAYFEEHKRRWKRDGVEAELDDGLRRQIAGMLLAEESVIPSVRNKMMRAIKTVKAAELPKKGAARERALKALTDRLEAQGVTVFSPPTFSREQEGFIPEIGLSEPLAEAIFATELSDPISARPVLSRQKAWGFLLLEREHPSREAFAEQKEATRAEYAEKLKEVVVAGFVQNFVESQDPQFNFEPLIEAYGEDTSRAPGGEAPKGGGL